jgi:hypothetical protein
LQSNRPAIYVGSNEKGHFQIVLGGIGTTLLVLVLVFIFIVWVGGFFRYAHILPDIFEVRAG